MKILAIGGTNAINTINKKEIQSAPTMYLFLCKGETKMDFLVLTFSTWNNCEADKTKNAMVCPAEIPPK